ncbi:thrombin-like enzyme bilineobin [Haematobia irritans]|uniref:thrombin-like enzyme bilineobin n=1 Tax=Haematobia irritans TaxID=7368 RepID=UPI003F4F712C
MRVSLFAIVIALLSLGQVHGIIKGKYAIEGEVYFMVALYDKLNGSLVCGGVIIANEWVLTAASCAENPQGMWAVAGSYFTSTLSSDRWQRPTVDYGIIHENYVKGQPHYDLALLHVSEPFVWTEYVRPAVLPQSGEIPSGEVHTFGYGQVTIGYPTTSMAVGIRSLSTTVLDWNICKQLLPNDLLLDERMLCTDQLARQSICKEDIGGPLVINRGYDELALLVGIASWAYLPCGMKQYPNVYTQVSLYLDWIQENTANRV